MQDQKINIFADKAYQVQDKAELRTGSLTLYTPVKKKKGQVFVDAADQLFSTAVSRIRQPIESPTSVLLCQKMADRRGNDKICRHNKL
ncbi:hypothetical protein [Candidatus Tisiphia endosymbiont of Sialis lutaria]|uniref:hypothetical protein n=1 Tax=Candidatus Tisiphia endosymbiont of Sialis lutaria TaxID=2029164 RepID=UPI00312CC141